MSVALPSPVNSSATADAAVTYSTSLTNALANSDKILARLTERYRANAAQARHMFLGNYGSSSSLVDERAATLQLQTKIANEYQTASTIVNSSNGQPRPPSTSGVGTSATSLQRPSRLIEESTGVLRTVEIEEESTQVRPVRDTEELLARRPNAATTPTPTAGTPATPASATALMAYGGGASSTSTAASNAQALIPAGGLTARQMLIASKREIDDVRPEWHAPWKLMRVIAGHAGWVRAIAVDHSNEWFVTGSVDRTIKIFDLASGNLKLTLTGHISGIRALAISKLTPYMFSVGEDKQVKCWDMEQNKVIRDYHAHLSGGYCCGLLENEGGPNILVTGGRDSVGRVWDIRTAAEVAVLCGHTQTVASIQCQMGLPQVITGSHDTTIKLWDLRKTAAPISTLTHHKKSVRALQIHPTEYTFTSGAGDNLKVWGCPEGTFLRNISGHNATINALAINRDNVLVSGADTGSLYFWDYKSGHSFQQHQTIPQPGSLDAESGIFALTFDQTGSRLLTAETDKSIKVYKEDENATEETHPLNWRPGKRRKRF